MKKLNAIVVACLMALSYVSANAQNEQPPTQVDAFCGQIVEITATPASGYRFVRWSDEDPAGVTQGATREIEVDANFQPITTFTAIFEPDSYTVNVSANEAEWGSVEVQGGESGDFGTTKTLVATATSACYRFVRWEDAAGATISTNASCEVTINATNNNYVAIFEQVTFQVNVASENTQFGTVTISKL